MRRKLVIGNWKMNLTPADGVACVRSFLAEVDKDLGVDVGIAPSFLTIGKVQEVTYGHQLLVGAQNCFWLEKGAFTGQVSASMLRDHGLDFCLVGHSETRGRFGKLEIPESTVPLFSESDESVNLKVKALLLAGLMPIICVGETLAERESGNTDSVIKAQIEGALEGILDQELDRIVIAYEPVWAIGTGKVCEDDEANRVCGHCRKTLAEQFGADASNQVRILYGGSVKASNARGLFHQPEIDGGLVGGASLHGHEFAEIIKAAL